jgi:hypothetical protein
LSISYNDEEPNRSDELIAFKWRIVEIVFAEDTLSSTKTFNKDQTSSTDWLINIAGSLQDAPQVAIDMAEIAVRQVQAALPRSRGGSPSSSLWYALPDERLALGEVDTSGPGASFSD